jgi:uncharacterized repeat protein (TIGR01451 family)
MKQKLKKGRMLLGLMVVIALVIGGIAGVPSVLASPGEYLLINPGDSVTITGAIGGDAIFEFFNPGDPTGSGVFDPFVRINTNKSIEKGYNTSYRKLEFDENSSPTFTKDYLLVNVPLLLVGGKYYREFQCDINQNNSADPDYYLSLDKLELYVTYESSLHGYPFSGLASLVWQMNFPEDWVKVNSLPNAGSGRRDFRVLIPDDVFVGGDHVVLFSQFGDHYRNNGGYEEWGVRVGVLPPPPPSPSIDIEKYVKIDDGNWLDADDPPVPGNENWIPAGTPVWYKIVVTNTGNVELTNIELTDVMLNNLPFYDIGDYPHPSSLGPGEYFEIELGPFVASSCFHNNVATVYGDYGGVTYSDADDAWFKAY